ncbi:hypothetical protein H9P43_001553 [Blastocladiella emersonii ATCC 22665]|nr:hypothetical protein H9P43_001553 [Blastocladiella emersonii ATCC 22665]
MTSSTSSTSSRRRACRAPATTALPLLLVLACSAAVAVHGMRIAPRGAAAIESSSHASSVAATKTTSRVTTTATQTAEATGASSGDDDGDSVFTILPWFGTASSSSSTTATATTTTYTNPHFTILPVTTSSSAASKTTTGDEDNIQFTILPFPGDDIVTHTFPVTTSVAATTSTTSVDIEFTILPLPEETSTKATATSTTVTDADAATVSATKTHTDDDEPRFTILPFPFPTAHSSATTTAETAVTLATIDADATETTAAATATETDVDAATVTFETLTAATATFDTTTVATRTSVSSSATAAPTRLPARPAIAFSREIPDAVIADNAACAAAAAAVDTDADVRTCFGGSLFYAAPPVVCSTDRALLGTTRPCFEVAVRAAAKLHAACPEPERAVGDWGRTFIYKAWSNVAAARDACTAFKYNPTQPKKPLTGGVAPPAIDLAAPGNAKDVPDRPAQGWPSQFDTVYALEAVWSTYADYRQYLWTAGADDAVDDAVVKSIICTEPVKTYWAHVKTIGTHLAVYLTTMADPLGFALDAARVCKFEVPRAPRNLTF